MTRFKIDKITKKNLFQYLFILAILFLAFFLRVYRINSLMSFGGDVARDYLSARDITLRKNIPLVGCPSSVPWLYQGSLFIYILGIILWIAKYNPLVGGYFVGILGVFAVLAVYFLGKSLFSKETGLLAALFYSTSPLIVAFDRYPYHQSMISLTTVLFILSLWQVRKNINYLILASFLFGLLMQLELSNLVLIPVLFFWCFCYRKEIYLKVLVLSIFLFLLTWLPKIIYDFNNGFTQTLGFIAWVGHKLPPLNIWMENQNINQSLLKNLFLILKILSKIVFWPSSEITAVIFVLMTLVLIKEGLRDIGKICFCHDNKFVLLLLLFIPILGFLVQGSPSEAYSPVLFGPTSLFIGSAVHFIRRRYVKLCVVILVFLIVGFNIYFLFEKNFLIKTSQDSLQTLDYDFGQSYSLNKEMAKFIVNDAQGEEFNIIPLGTYGKFSSSTLNFKYLCWYFGNEPSERREKLKYFVYNKNENIKIKQAFWVKEFTYLVLAKVIER